MLSDGPPRPPGGADVVPTGEAPRGWQERRAASLSAQTPLPPGGGSHPSRGMGGGAPRPEGKRGREGVDGVGRSPRKAPAAGNRVGNCRAAWQGVGVGPFYGTGFRAIRHVATTRRGQGEQLRATGGGVTLPWASLLGIRVRNKTAALVGGKVSRRWHDGGPTPGEHAAGPVEVPAAGAEEAAEDLRRRGGGDREDPRDRSPRVLRDCGRGRGSTWGRWGGMDASDSSGWR